MISQNTFDAINGPGAAEELRKFREDRAAEEAGKRAMILAMNEEAARPDGVLLPQDEQDISGKVHSGQVPVVRIPEA